MARGFSDYGHGGADSGAINGSRYEKNDVLSIGKKVTNRLREHGVEITESRTDDSNPSLKERTDIENASRYDFAISFHRNSFSNPSANGVETHVMLGYRDKAAGRLAKAINERVANLGFYNRGVKESDFHMLRETNSSACLIEMGFISNDNDNSIFDNRFNDIIEAIVQGVCEFLGMAYNPPYVAPPTPPVTNQPNGDTFFRVVVGSYNSRENAVAQQEKLKQAGFDSFLLAYKK